MLPAILSGCRPRTDGSWSITLSTNILREDEYRVILNMHQQLICVLIKDSDILADEVEVFDSVDLDLIDAKVSPSKRQMNIIYRIWEQKGKQGDFKDYYKTRMNRNAENLKSELE